MTAQTPTYKPAPIRDQLRRYIPAFAACWFAGWLSWNLYEKHFLKLKRFFPYVRKPRAGDDQSRSAA